MKHNFKVGDLARSVNSRWPLLNHRLIQIVAIASPPPYAGRPYLIRRVDGYPWCFPNPKPAGRLRFIIGRYVWAAESDLLPLDSVDASPLHAKIEVTI